MEAASDPTLDEMRALLPTLLGPDLEARTAAILRNQRLNKPAGSLGRLEDLAVWLATWQAKHPATVRHPRIALFAAAHGIEAKLPQLTPSRPVADIVAGIIAGGAAINQLSSAADADLRVYEMALDQPTADFSAAPAMSEADCARAMAYGMMAVEMGVDLLVVGDIATGNILSAASLCLALFGGTASDWLPTRDGAELVEQAVAFHAPQAQDRLDLLRRLGGLELAAMTGAVIAARRGRVPVVLDGFASTVAAAVLFAMDRRALDHCVVGHVADEPGHRKLLIVIGQKPILDLDIKLAEGAGAALALGIIKAAALTHADMTTID